MRFLLLVVLVGCVAAKSRWYDTFGENELTDAQLQAYVANGTTTFCVIQAEDCDPKEGRRLDDTCNWLKNPVRGARFTVNKRLLPAVYGKNNEPRLAKSGKPLPLSRKVRTSTVFEGSVPSRYHTHLVTYFWVYMVLDNTISQDTLNYVINRPYCCLEKGKSDPMCTPNPIPADDPTHRFSEVRCGNMSRPASYQNQGCVNPNGTPDRLNAASVSIDLSFLYGSSISDALAARLNDSGLLRFEIDEQGREWPPSIKNNPQGTCRLNVLPDEVRCNETPVAVTNTIAGANVFTNWMWRHHNFIARKLKAVNPTWTDDQLFYTARDINIATATQMYMYELLPAFFGRERMIEDGVIGRDAGHRDVYDQHQPPTMTHEYMYSLRWLHTIQEGIVKQYDKDGNYLKEIPVGNLTFRTGYLAIDNNFESITQGAFRQPCAASDYLVDTEVAETSLGPLQRSLDLLTNDNAKARYLGLQPYHKYLEYCTGKAFNSWESLEAFIDIDKIDMLRNVYEHVEDVELLPGIWMERLMKDAFVPPTLYCLTKQQLIRTVATDRHFYERPNRPYAFTAAQLAEVRKVTMARFLCNVGDGVTEIQPEAFKRISKYNPLTSCDKLPAMDFSHWGPNSANNGGIELGGIFGKIAEAAKNKIQFSVQIG